MASDFLSRMRARSVQVGEGAAGRVGEVGRQVGTELVLTTPVDTGEARSNWLASKNVPKTNTVPPTSASAAMGAIDAVIASLSADDELYIANNVGHIGKLNDGSSQQAPTGFVEAAVQRAARGGGNVKVFKG